MEHRCLTSEAFYATRSPRPLFYMRKSTSKHFGPLQNRGQEVSDEDLTKVARGLSRIATRPWSQASRRRCTADKIRFFYGRTKITIHHHTVGTRLGTANLRAISHKAVDNGAWFCQVSSRL